MGTGYYAQILHNQQRRQQGKPFKQNALILTSLLFLHSTFSMCNVLLPGCLPVWCLLSHQALSSKRAGPPLFGLQLHLWIPCHSSHLERNENALPY